MADLDVELEPVGTDPFRVFKAKKLVCFQKKTSYGGDFQSVDFQSVDFQSVDFQSVDFQSANRQSTDWQ